MPKLPQLSKIPEFSGPPEPSKAITKIFQEGKKKLSEAKKGLRSLVEELKK